jgi:hypothetical protein
MGIWDKYAPFVKEQCDLQAKLARRYAEEPWRHDLHVANLSTLKSLASDLVDMDEELARLNEEIGKNTPKQNSMVLTPKDLDGLPDEVMRELSISDADRQEFAIIGLIDDAGGILSLDKIIVGIFRKTNEAVKRNALTSRLYRMAQKQLIFGVPLKKGFYATRPISESDARRIFGIDGSEEENAETGT